MNAWAQFSLFVAGMTFATGLAGLFRGDVLSASFGLTLCVLNIWAAHAQSAHGKNSQPKGD
jgi:hypothetical protein